MAIFNKLKLLLLLLLRLLPWGPPAAHTNLNSHKNLFSRRIIKEKRKKRGSDDGERWGSTAPEMIVSKNLCLMALS
jgi:hypothetical protein